MINEYVKKKKGQINENIKKELTNEWMDSIQADLCMFSCGWVLLIPALQTVNSTEACKRLRQATSVICGGISTNVGSMLGQRRRRWANIEPALDECLVFLVSEAAGRLVRFKGISGVLLAAVTGLMNRFNEMLPFCHPNRALRVYLSHSMPWWWNWIHSPWTFQSMDISMLLIKAIIQLPLNHPPPPPHPPLPYSRSSCR